MHGKNGIGLLTISVALAAGSVFGEVKPVPGDEAQRWLNWVLPLPKQIAIERKHVGAPQKVAITCRAGAGAIEQSAGAELRRLFKDKGGADPVGGEFEILLGVVEAKGQVAGVTITNFAQLKQLPNSDQAYVIQPAGENKLVLAGLTEKGVFYAALTLSQLLEPGMTKGTCEIPLASVIDWPDVAERGLWNCGTLIVDAGYRWKLNFSRANATYDKLQRDKPAHASVKTNELECARLHAVNHMPTMTHLNFLDRTGLFTVYPELKGQGDSAVAGQYHAHQIDYKDEHRVPCASNPILTKILTDWMMDIAAAGVPECGCWLTERAAQCGCAPCKATGQFVLEARAYEKAWQEVRKKYPGFKIRIFISTPTEEKYDQVLKELPEGVGIERACAFTLGRRRHEPRDIFFNEVADAFAARGGWVATYDVPISANGKVETPEFKLPESSAARIHDFVGQMAGLKYSGIYGMLPHEKGLEVCGMNIVALAEWSWNLKGRTEKEFALAWATREGYARPEKVAEWSELMGPVEWDVYDSGFPECYSWGEAVKLVQERKKPVLGEGMFRYYADKESFDRKLETCRKALSLAQGINKPYLANETKVVSSYVELAKRVFLIADLAANGDLTKPEVKGEIKKQVEALRQAGAENMAAIKAWRAAIGPEPWHRRVALALKATEETVNGIARSVEVK